MIPRFTKKRYIYKAINRERGNCLPKVKEAIIYIYIYIIFIFIFIFILYFISLYIFSYFFLCQPPSHSLLLPADRQPFRV